MQVSRQNTDEHNMPGTNRAASRPTLEDLYRSLAEDNSNEAPRSNAGDARRSTTSGAAPCAAPLSNVAPLRASQNSTPKTGTPQPLGYKPPRAVPGQLLSTNPLEGRHVAVGSSATQPQRASGTNNNIEGAAPPEMFTTTERNVPVEVGKLPPLELIFAIKAQTDHSSIFKKLRHFCLREAHNPLLELASGTVAFVSLEQDGRIRVLLGHMRNFSLFTVKTNTLEGVLELEELYEYDESYGQLLVTHKRAEEVAKSIAGRKMYPVLEFTSYTVPGLGKAKYQIKSQWR